MPACISHWVYAEKIFTYIKSKTERNINVNAFFLGAQGPDVFFCSRILPLMKGESIRDFGHKVHGIPVYKLLLMVKEDDALYLNDAVFSYTLGLICHWAMDSYCHPFVCALADSYASKKSAYTPSSAHVEIESAIDSIVCEKYLFKKINKFHLKECFCFDGETKRAVIEFYKKTDTNFTSLNISENKITESLQDAVKAHKLLNDQFFIKKKLLRLFEGKKVYYSANFRPYKDDEIKDALSTEKVCGMNFYDCLNKAEEKAARLAGSFLVKDKNYSSAQKEFMDISEKRAF